MELACEKINQIICIDAEGQENFLLPQAFCESTDKINIITQVLNTNLRRGWQGDLVYTVDGLDLKTMGQEKAIQTTYHNVLLVKVRSSWSNDSIVEWEYVFFKH